MQRQALLYYLSYDRDLGWGSGCLLNKYGKMKKEDETQEGVTEEEMFPF